jgi:hypothetical protein
MRAAFPVLFALLLVSPAYATPYESAAETNDVVKNPEESGPSHILVEQPKLVEPPKETTGKDIGKDEYPCSTITFRREDGGVTKVRKCDGDK